jgi:hypothetical protein
VKTDVRDLGASDFRDTLASLDKIRSVRFRYKQEVETAARQPDVLPESPTHIGVIAQSLPAELVRENGQGLLGMNVADMVAFLVASVRGVRGEASDLHREGQEQMRQLQDKIGMLEQDNATKERALREQGARLNALEAKLKLLEEQASLAEGSTSSHADAPSLTRASHRGQ